MSATASIRSQWGGGKRGERPGRRSGLGTKLAVLLLLVALSLIVFVTGLVRGIG